MKKSALFHSRVVLWTAHFEFSANGWVMKGAMGGWGGRWYSAIPHVHPFVPWMSPGNNIAWLNTIEKLEEMHAGTINFCIFIEDERE